MPSLLKNAILHSLTPPVTDATRSVLQENLASIRARIAAAATRAGRPASSVTLVAITKSVTSDVAAHLYALGAADLGENRVQELVTKAAAVPGARWHLVGPLQSNKARKAIAHSQLLHAVDSPELFPPLQRIAAEENCIVRCLLEVNISGEATKHGIAPGAVSSVLQQSKLYDRVEVRGLMTMAPAGAPAAEIRNIFSSLRILRDEGLARGFFHGAGELSMGMSEDFEIAVEEGATLVRVGSALYKNLQFPSRLSA